MAEPGLRIGAQPPGKVVDVGRMVGWNQQGGAVGRAAPFADGGHERQQEQRGAGRREGQQHGRIFRHF
ncbi:hypothetical protein AVME950_22320 [Acidovorax sp. SUPP950]|uniref:hypothetical protein n=1 Tax=Acidovorax sp. SUPP950 TaxID=511901 RepID=UPI0023C2D11C|nr:hypothetical protein [Acidovorax sp. SUPP950]GKS77682.1 hypothetical protein AVME950_22320 [Acidovorax sp. SUPP950]